MPLTEVRQKVVNEFCQNIQAELNASDSANSSRDSSVSGRVLDTSNLLPRLREIRRHLDNLAQYYQPIDKKKLSPLPDAKMSRARFDLSQAYFDLAFKFFKGKWSGFQSQHSDWEKWELEEARKQMQSTWDKYKRSMKEKWRLASDISGQKATWSDDNSVVRDGGGQVKCVGWGESGMVSFRVSSQWTSFNKNDAGFVADMIVNASHCGGWGEVVTFNGSVYKNGAIDSTLEDIVAQVINQLSTRRDVGFSEIKLNESLMRSREIKPAAEQFNRQVEARKQSRERIVEEEKVKVNAAILFAKGLAEQRVMAPTASRDRLQSMFGQLGVGESPLRSRSESQLPAEAAASSSPLREGSQPASQVSERRLQSAGEGQVEGQVLAEAVVPSLPRETSQLASSFAGQMGQTESVRQIENEMTFVDTFVVTGETLKPRMEKRAQAEKIAALEKKIVALEEVINAPKQTIAEQDRMIEQQRPEQCAVADAAAQTGMDTVEPASATNSHHSNLEDGVPPGEPQNREIPREETRPTEENQPTITGSQAAMFSSPPTNADPEQPTTATEPKSEESRAPVNA